MKHLEYVPGLNKCYEQIKTEMYIVVNSRVKNLSSMKAVTFCVSLFDFSELKTMPGAK